MVQTSSGVKAVRLTSESQLFRQYAQLKIHSFVKSIFNKEIHLPSAEKEWQMPGAIEFPMPPLPPLRLTPLDVQATSYFAAPDSTVSFSNKSISICNSIPLWHPSCHQVSKLMFYLIIPQSETECKRNQNICSHFLFPL